MNLFDFIIVVIEIAIVLFYCSTLYDFNKPINLQKILLVSATVIVVTFSGSLRLPTYVNLIISYCVCLLFSHYMFCGEIRSKVFCALIYIVASIFADILAANLITFLGISYDVVGSDNITYIVGATLSNFIRLWLCTYVGRILSRNMRGLPVSYWIFMIVCPVLSVLCLVIFDIYLMQAEEVNQLMVFIPSFCILYINFMLFRFFETYSSNIRLKVVEKLSEQNEENYKVLKNNEDELRVLRHDMKNHIMVLHEHIKNNDLKAAEKHLKSIEKTLKNLSSVVYTSNSAIDAALNIGGRKAQAEGVRYDVQVQVNGDVNIDAADLCKLLNNAIDNAIDAAAICENPYIFAELNISDNEMKIHIENSTKLQSKPSVFATTKADKKNHGYGMRSMKDVVKRYDGVIKSNISQGVFYLNINLKNKLAD